MQLNFADPFSESNKSCTQLQYQHQHHQPTMMADSHPPTSQQSQPHVKHPQKEIKYKYSTIRYVSVMGKSNYPESKRSHSLSPRATACFGLV